MFLISKLWISPLENHSPLAYGYKHIGYVATKEEAATITNSKMIKKSLYPWPLCSAHEFEGDSVPMYMAEELKPVNIGSLD